jgi:predicted nucleotidyltransferase
MKSFESRDISQKPIIEQLKRNELFQVLAVPIDLEKFPIIRDTEFYIRKDGLIINAEGWYHPEDKLIGEVLYAPDQGGDKKVFGQKYRKVTLYPQTNTPVPYDKRSKILRKYDPSLDQVESNPYFAKYKQIFDRNDFIAYLPNREVLQKITTQLSIPEDTVTQDIQDVQKLLDIDLINIPLGVTGGSLMGNFRNFHDFDLVFQGSLNQNLRIAKAMRNLVRREPHRRIIEGGKGWNIRFYNDKGTFMCNFFSYNNPEDAPLRMFEMEVLTPDLTIEGIVSDDIHSVYTPTILGLDQVKVLQIGQQKRDVEVPEKIQLIAYHTATRGECFAGDKVNARGALVNVKTPKGEYRAVCIIDREGIRNLTPNWEGFYKGF